MKVEGNYLLTVTNYRLSKLSTLTQLHLIRIGATMTMTNILTVTMRKGNSMSINLRVMRTCSPYLRGGRGAAKH